jgi:hypothetical protein
MTCPIRDYVVNVCPCNAWEQPFDLEVRAYTAEDAITQAVRGGDRRRVLSVAPKEPEPVTIGIESALVLPSAEEVAQ